MARTITFSFAQGGGSTFTNGRVTLSPTHMRIDGDTVILPGASDPIELVAGAGQITDVEPTPTASDGWRYQIVIEGTDRRKHVFIVSVPAGTTPINFATLPVIENMTLPIDATGVQLEQWMQSIRSHAAAANANAVAALASAASAHNRIDGLEIGGDPAAILPSGGITNQVLAKKSNTDFDLKWTDAPAGGGGSTPLSGQVLSVFGNAAVARPTTSTDVVVLFFVPGNMTPINAISGLDVWMRTL